MTAGMPGFVRRRPLWLLPLLLWAGAVALSLRAHLHELERHNLDVAGEGIRKMFHMVVLTRAWNAGHGRVYVPVTENMEPNPYLEHPRRDVTTTDGDRLTMVNPAYMTRQMAELAFAQGEIAFHITSLRPIRPHNAADAWEADALAAFERGEKERLEVVTDTGGTRRLRYMAPLVVAPPCLACHAKQGYRVGDIRGGISVSLPHAPIELAARPVRQREIANHAAVFLFVTLAGWGLLELLRRRWLDLDQHIVALRTARDDLAASNRSLAEARDAAESASRAKSGFLATMSHELRTPLNAILGMAELLRLDAPTPEQSERIDALHRSGTHLLGLVNAVLDFTRLESSPLDIAETAFSPANLVDDLTRQFAPAALAKGLRLEGRHHEDRLPVLGDYGHIRRILANLLDNAIKFTDRGEVVLEARTEPAGDGRARLAFRVADTGIGMDDATLDRLFRPFELADASTTRRHAGIGLGLAVARRLAIGLGGDIQVGSQAGIGSEFVLRLDLAAAPATASDTADLDLTALIGLLEQDDLRASELFTAQAGSLRACLGDRFTELEKRMADYDYAGAADWLRRAGR